MRTVVQPVLRAAIVLFVTASTTFADPVVITAGFLQYARGPASPRTAFTGADFSFEGLGGSPDSVFWAYSICMEPVCVPGRNLDLRARWGGELSGGGQHNGRPFAVNLVSVAQLNAQWTGSLLIPLGFTGGSLSAPFAFTADLLLPEAPGFASRHVLTGAGTATLDFTLGTVPEFPGALILNSLRYEFASPAPTPEPASLLLLSTGLAGVWWRVRRRSPA
jgi:hypothetical protein